MNNVFVIFTYDLDGNLIKKSHKTKDIVYTYSWDNFGKLAGLLIEKDGELYRELGFKYDGAGRRVEKLFVDYKNASESYVRGAYDLYSTMMKGVEIQEKYEKKINKIKNEQKTCSSSKKLKLEQEKMKLLNQMQMESMANAATAYLPGVGSAAAVGACLLMLSTF